MQVSERDIFLTNRVKEHYDELVSLGFEVVGVFLQGSQNYELDIYNDDYTSDVDTKAIVLPSLKDIVSGKEPFSHTYVRANNEHIDIKDIRCMFDMFKKQNNAYLEILFTKYFCINPKYLYLLRELYSYKERIVRIDVNRWLKASAGTCREKYKALEHPFPNAIEKINRFGYDPKQLHHILRVNLMMKNYLEGRPYNECLVFNEPTREYLKSIKVGDIPLELAREYASRWDNSCFEMMKDNISDEFEVDTPMLDILDSLKERFIVMYLREELANTVYNKTYNEIPEIDDLEPIGIKAVHDWE